MSLIGDFDFSTFCSTSRTLIPSPTTQNSSTTILTGTRCPTRATPLLGGRSGSLADAIHDTIVECRESTVSRGSVGGVGFAGGLKEPDSPPRVLGDDRNHRFTVATINFMATGIPDFRSACDEARREMSAPTVQSWEKSSASAGASLAESDVAVSWEGVDTVVGRS